MLDMWLFASRIAVEYGTTVPAQAMSPAGGPPLAVISCAVDDGCSFSFTPHRQTGLGITLPDNELDGHNGHRRTAPDSTSVLCFAGEC